MHEIVENLLIERIEIRMISSGTAVRVQENPDKVDEDQSVESEQLKS